MKEYNDYVETTRRYLRSYAQLQITVKNLTDDIEASKAMLQDESVAISRYGGEPGGGSGELNATESAANRRIKITEHIAEMERDKAEIERVLRKVDRAMDGLGDADRDLVQGHFIDGYSWSQLGNKSYCTEKWARDKGNKALKEVAFMVFGVCARPRQLRFVFAG
jgi:hypothetical protein